MQCLPSLIKILDYGAAIGGDTPKLSYSCGKNRYRPERRYPLVRPRKIEGMVAARKTRATMKKPSRNAIIRAWS